jgi:hypothetical protein
MQKTIIGFVTAGVLMVVMVSGFFFFMKDESKVAEVVVQEKTVKQETMQTEKFKEKEMTKVEKEIIQQDKIEPKSEIIVKTKNGSFNKIDALHYASGNVSVESLGENYKIKFANNFSSANGPDLYVYLASPQKYRNIAIGGVDTSKTLNLGLLKNLKGEQEYLVSKKDFEQYGDAIVIWCKQFGVQFSRAELK